MQDLRELFHAASDQNPFDFIETDLVVAPVVEAGGAGALVVRHLLRHFELAAVAQIFRDAGRAEAVAADLRLDAGVRGAAADHAVDVGLAHRAGGEIARLPFGRAEEPCLWVEGRAVLLRRGLDGLGVSVQVSLELVVAGHLMMLAAFFVQANPGLAPLHEHVLDAHLQDGADARKGEGHERDQRAIAQAHDAARVDRSRAGRGPRRPSARASCLSSPNASGRVRRWPGSSARTPISHRWYSMFLDEYQLGRTALLDARLSYTVHAFSS